MKRKRTKRQEKEHYRYEGQRTEIQLKPHKGVLGNKSEQKDEN